MSFRRPFPTNNKNRLKSLPKTYTRGKNIFTGIGKTHLFTWQKGSYTLEAAIVLPLTAAIWVCILFLFRMLQVETAVQESLYYASRMTAVESCEVENETALLASAEVLFRKELAESPLVDTYVRGGSSGISLLRSDLDGDTVDLKAEYTFKMPVDFFHLPGIAVVQSSSSRKWTGKDPLADGDGDDEYVYYTDYGSVYHTTESCRYLNPGIQKTTLSLIGSLRSRDGNIYYACSDCGADQITSGTVYYTPYGTNYHASVTCSGLKRTIHKVKKSQVGNLKPCSACGGE